MRGGSVSGGAQCVDKKTRTFQLVEVEQQLHEKDESG